MFVADLKRIEVLLFNSREQQQTLGVGMAKKEECQSLQDVEEGEISDSASVEEISEEDFIKQESNVPNSISISNSNPHTKSKVWTMGDLYKYPISRNYASGLYNLAWAQAVQNKPLDEVLVMDFKSNEKSDSKRSALSDSLNGRDANKNSSGICVDSSAKEVNSKVIIDVDDDDNMNEVCEGEKEDGELEEGEIDLDSEFVKGLSSSNDNELDVNVSDNDLKRSELQRRVNSIREALESLAVDDAEKSFDRFCSRLQKSLDTLWEIIRDDSFPQKDALVQLSLSAIKTLQSAFQSMNHDQKEQNRDNFLRLLAHVISLKPSLFPTEQTKEIEVMISSLDSPVVSLSTKDGDKEKELQISKKLNRNGSEASDNDANQDLTSLKKYALDSFRAEPLDQNDPIMLSKSLKSGVPGVKSRGMLLPLLDLHKDHDVDSLPSPTRETTPCVLLHKTLASKPGLPVPSKAPETENGMTHLYETDALRAVSTYQEKFGRSSFSMSDRLPSPTPSEASDDGDDDTGGEVSSLSTVQNLNTVTVSCSSQPIVSSTPATDISGGQGLYNTKDAGFVSSGSTIVSRASAKSRDPRFRFANSDAGALHLNQRPFPVVNNELKIEPLVGIIGSRRQKIAEDPVLDGPALKRQRSELTDPGVVKDFQAVSGSGGWLEDIGTVGMPVPSRDSGVQDGGSDPRMLKNAVNLFDTSSSSPNATAGGNGHLPFTSVGTTASLHSLLKDIAVNPVMWMNIIQREQQKSVVPAKNTTKLPNMDSILGSVPLLNVVPPKPSVLGQRSDGILQTPQTALLNSQDESGKIRMKPRDPRRVLHNNTLQTGGSLVVDKSKTDTSGTLENMGNLNGQKQEDQLDKKSVSSQSITPPDIARLFTKNLKNIADIILVSQVSLSPPPGPQVSSSQQVHPSGVDVKAVVSDSGNLRSLIGSASEVVGTCPPQSQNTWGDVEHLFKGFDDQQKAAIQRERARRIEEQKKMFDARKLCLVLDLDHTLLNSAKFVEVDPVHDEMLRKKEEEDRQKQQRHLFRFPHMGMWTKLRPGIWNFLEKASKLYELHLYTMGNKLYATEMAKVLDPKGDLFAGRVISRGDDGDLFYGDEKVPKSKDLEGVLGMESAVVIIDDSVRVWPHNKLNLIVVERYIYFPCSRRQFGLPGPSLLEIDHDERPEDGTLASSLAVIERIHQNFFSHCSLDEADVRNILASEQRKILAGCRIVFSRVFPVGEANPHLHPLWQAAEQFGAVCTNQIDEQVTHVVANSLGTDKVNWALSTGRFVVHPGWVEASALLYRRANEHDFAIKP